MRCQQALERIADLVDGNISWADRLWLQLHVLICRDCRRYVSSYIATIRAEKSAFLVSDGLGRDNELPEGEVATILESLRDKSRHC